MAPLASTLIFSFTIFLSAAIMFLLEPLIAKILLPYLGGSSLVWNTCVVFFQSVLLTAYAYALLLNLPQIPRSIRIALHILLLGLSCFCLPIKIEPVSILTSDEHPYFYLFCTLAQTIGPLFFILASSAPLLQKWYVTSSGAFSKDPYILYAASNAGALLGLIAYPFAVEPNFGLKDQTGYLSIAYAVFCLLLLACSVVFVRAQKDLESDFEYSREPKPGLKLIGSWFYFSFLPASLVLGLTSYVTSELSSIPLFWILPLSLYILSFVIAFSRFPSKIIPALSIVTSICLLTLLAFSLNTYISDRETTTLGGFVTSGISFHLVCLFLLSLTCHARIADSRPNPQHLNLFYLVIAMGGVSGSIFNTFVAPLAFNDFVEYPLVLAACAVSLLCANIPPRMKPAAALAPWIVLSAVLAVLIFWNMNADPRTVVSKRNFFGLLSIKIDKSSNSCQLWDGCTMHGEESLDPQKLNIPCSYYSRQGPLGELMLELSRCGSKDVPYAVIGMGTGTAAAYAQPGQPVLYYELNPAVIDIATNPFYFTFLYEAKKRKSDLQITAGDGRLKIKSAPDKYLDLIIIDAYSSDSIPTHLLTQEALNLYLSKLTDKGTIAFHVTNTYYDLKPVLAKLAKSLGLQTLSGNDFHTGKSPLKEPSDWMIISKNQDLLNRLKNNKNWQEVPSPDNIKIWTDDYCDLLSVLKIPFS